MSLIRLLLLLLFPFFLNGNSIIPLDLKNGANSSFRDDFPDDGKGGWTDQGSCDMRLFPAGTFTADKVRFNILSDTKTNGKSCIVVGNMKNRKHFPQKAKIEVNVSKHRPVLYLLHAGQWLKRSSKPAGVLRIEYTDGSYSSHNLRYGRDLLNWIGDDNSPAKNARKVWTLYNDSSQVSLFLSKIGIKSGKIIKSLEFESGSGTWMVAAVSLGKPVKIKGISKELHAIPDDYKIPEAIKISGWQQKRFPSKPQNVILIIGDGMGYGAIKSASFYAHGAANKLVMNSLPVKTDCITRSFGGGVTDSAAAGTALSGGYKTKNGMLGVNPEKVSYDSIASEAKKSGKSVALITTDHMLGSTQAAFYTHVPSRGMKAEIAASALDCGFDFLIASPDRRYFLPPRSLNGVDYMKRFESAGYILFDSMKTFLSSGNLTKAVGTFSTLNSTDDLAKVTEKVLLSLEKNPKGFFIMIESGIPDQGGHANRPDKTVFGTLCADHVVKIAIEYAIRNGNTLVIVTADHETGGVSAKNNPENHKKVLISYTSGQHTDQNVPVFVYGPGAEQFAKKLDNTDIPKIISGLLELPLGNKSEN